MLSAIIMTFQMNTFGTDDISSDLESLLDHTTQKPDKLGSDFIASSASPSEAPFIEIIDQKYLVTFPGIL